jgi:hypothetical protein
MAGRARTHPCTALNLVLLGRVLLYSCSSLHDAAHGCIQLVMAVCKFSPQYRSCLRSFLAELDAFALARVRLPVLLWTKRHNRACGR